MWIMPAESATSIVSSIMSLSSWFHSWLAGGTHADMRMAIALALTDEVLSTARDLRTTLEPGTRARAPFMMMWKNRLETEQRHRASYIRAID